jgi:hypothetical protein
VAPFPVERLSEDARLPSGASFTYPGRASPQMLVPTPLRCCARLTTARTRAPRSLRRCPSPNTRSQYRGDQRR